jgi:predicted Zn finger-like uncharacterized protein
MIVICPSCSTSYEVDEAAFGRRPRTVACTACEARWTQEPAFELPLNDAWPAEPQTDAALTMPAPPADARPTVNSPELPESIEPVGDANGVTLVEAADSIDGTLQTPETPSDDTAPPDRFETDVPPPPVMVAPLNPAHESEAFAPDAPADEPMSLRDRLKSAMAAQGGPPAADTFDGAEADAPPLPAEPAAAAEGAPDGHDTEDTPADIDAILDAEAARFERRERLRRALLPAAVAALVLIALLAAALFARGAIVALVPAAGVVFAALGMAPEGMPEGLEFRDVSKVRDWAEGEDALVVTGHLYNGTSQSMPVPAVRIVLLDAEEVELQSVVVSLPAKAIAPGESLPFEARVESPALAAEHIRLTLLGSSH